MHYRLMMVDGMVCEELQDAVLMSQQSVSSLSSLSESEQVLAGSLSKGVMHLANMVQPFQVKAFLIGLCRSSLYERFMSALQHQQPGVLQQLEQQEQDKRKQQESQLRLSRLFKQTQDIHPQAYLNSNHHHQQQQAAAANGPQQQQHSASPSSSNSLIAQHATANSSAHDDDGAVNGALCTISGQNASPHDGVAPVNRKRRLSRGGSPRGESPDSNSMLPPLPPTTRQRRLSVDGSGEGSSAGLPGQRCLQQHEAVADEQDELFMATGPSALTRDMSLNLWLQKFDQQKLQRTAGMAINACNGSSQHEQDHAVVSAAGMAIETDNESSRPETASSGFCFNFNVST